MKGTQLRKKCISMLLATTMTVSLLPGAVPVAAAEISLGLEDAGKITYYGASARLSETCGEVVEVTTDWASATGHAIMNDPENLFQVKAFTLLADVKIIKTNEKEADKKAAFTIGTEGNNLHILTQSGKLGYGKSTGGLSENNVELSVPLNSGWNSLALVYDESSGKSTVTLYLNGQKAASVEDVGFKLSEMSGLSAMLGRSFATNYLLPGLYDNIVVTDGAMSESEAVNETTARAEAKKNDITLMDASLVTINGTDVDTAAQNMNGLTFKGFGILDGNGTDALLLDYKAVNPEKYWEMMELLFGGKYPLIRQIKIEMGNDKNTSTSPHVCTMRTEDEYPDVTRVTGFQLAADAKTINPDLKVSVLRWVAPGWVKDNDDVYKWYKNTILAAYREYGYMVDTVNPDVNEHASDNNWIKRFASLVSTDETGFLSSDNNAGFRDEAEKALFQEIQVIISDEVGIASCGDALIGDAALQDAVDIIGYHYNTDDDSKGNFKKLADIYDKEVWNSEAQATFGSTADRPNNNGVESDKSGTSTGVGGSGSPLEMANTIIKGFVNSRRTHVIYQPAIEAYYEGGQYNYKSLLSARDPWSGYINYDGALGILSHFAKFAVTGWEYDTPDDNVVWRGIPSASKTTATGTNPVNGRNGGDNYMTLAAPDKSDFSVVLVNDSEKSKTYCIKPVDLALGANAMAEVWETRAADDGVYSENYMHCVQDNLAMQGGFFTVTVKPWSIVTLTTLDIAGTAAEKTTDYQPLPTATEDGRWVLDTDATGKVQKTDDNILYADDYDYKGMSDFVESRGGADGFYPLYTHDTNGAFEVVLKNGTGVLTQNGQSGGGSWNGGDPCTTLGDYRWANYKVSVDFNLTTAANNMYLGARQRGAAGGGDNKINMSAYAIGVHPSGSWTLLRYGSVIESGYISIQDPAACRVALQVAGDTVTAYIDGTAVTTYTDPQPQLSGRVQLACSFEKAEFDNLLIETVPGYSPYFENIIDNLHMRQWGGDSEGQDALVYEGDWLHKNQTSSSDSQRSRSTTSTKGSSVSLTFTGTGLDLIGSNNGNAKLDVIVDGEQLYTAAPTVNTVSHMPFFSLRGLENKEHTVTIALVEGKLSVDSVGWIAAQVDSGSVDKSALTAAIAQQDMLKEQDYDPKSWQTYQASIAGNVWGLQQIKKAATDPATWGLDQQGADQLAAYLYQLGDKLLGKDTPIAITSTDLPTRLAVTVGEALPTGLPTQVNVHKNDDTDGTAGITWVLSGKADTPYGVTDVVGTVTGGKNPADGSPLTITIPVEVLPKGLTYFIDSGATGENARQVWGAVKAAVPELLNDMPDQTSDGTVWGYKSDGTNQYGSSADSTNKFDSGMWLGSGKSAVYYLPLKAGTYLLSAGFHEWWSQTRPMNHSVTYTDGGVEKTVKGSVINLSGSSQNQIGTIPFILEEDTVVTYTVSKASSSDPVISWVAVAAVGSGEEEQQEPIFVANGENSYDGILKFSTVTTTQDPEKGEVLYMNGTPGAYAQFDPDKISFAGRENMTVSFDLKSTTAEGNFFTFGLGQDSNKYMFLRTRANDVYTALTKSGYNNEQKSSADVATLDKWVHVDLVFTPERLATYINGRLAGSIEKSILVSELGLEPVAYLGKSFFSGDAYFQGYFSDVRVYNRALTDTELSNNAIYTLSVVEEFENGSVTLSKSAAKEGETVTVTVLPEDYFQLTEGSLKYIATADIDKMSSTTVSYKDSQKTTTEPTEADIEALPENTWLLYRPGSNNWGGGSDSDGRVWANNKGSYGLLKFTGTGIDLNVVVRDSATLDVYLDGELVSELNTPTGKPCYSVKDLEMGSHTIKMVVNANQDSTSFCDLYNAVIAAPTEVEETPIIANEQGIYTVTVPAKDITILAAFESDGTVVHDVSYTLEHLSADSAPKRTPENETFRITLSADAGYVLPESISVTMGGEALVAGEGYTYDSQTGILEVYTVSGALVLTAVGTKEREHIGGTVAISGVAAYGNTLTADLSGVTPVDAVLNCTWSRDGVETGSGETYVLTAADIGSIITLTVSSAEDFVGTLTAVTDTVTKAKGPEAPVEDLFTVTHESASGAQDGAVSGLTEEMEWSADSNTWDDTYLETRSNLAPGNYQVRYRESDTQLHSDSLVLTINAFGMVQQPQPQAIFNAADMTLANLEEGMAYSLDGGVSWNTVTASTVHLEESGLGTEHGIWIRTPGDGVITSDSPIQVISLDRAEAPTGVIAQNETAEESGAILGTTTDMQYRLCDGGIWAACANESTAVAPGVYEVRVAGQGTKLAGAAVTVTVTAYVEPEPEHKPVTGVTLDVNSATLYTNTSPSSQQLTALVQPADADNATVVWTSSAPTVATVDTNGLVTAVGEGTATITVTTVDGSFTASCSVQVTTYYAPYNPPVSGGSTNTETVVNTDGSKTTTVTDKKAGTVTETTKHSDGKTVTKVTEKTGAVTVEVQEPDGKQIKTAVTSQGDMSIVVMDKDGRKAAEINVPVEIPAPENGFTDVPENSWAKKEIDFVVGMGLFQGTGDGVFDAEVPMTRGMLATVLHRLSGKVPGSGTDFADVSSDAYYADAVSWAAGNGIVNGVGTGNFAPDSNIARESLVVMLYRFATLVGMDTQSGDSNLDSFNDSGDVSSWAVEAMNWAVKTGLVNGKDGQLAPSEEATRAEVATILMRFVTEITAS